MSETFSDFILATPGATLPFGNEDYLAVIQAGLTKRVTPQDFARQIPLDSPSPTEITESGDYSVLSGDVFLAVKIAALVTILLPAVTTQSRVLTISDCGGNALLFPISVVPQASDNIDGLSSFSLISPWQSVTLVYIPGFHLWKAT